MSVPATVTKILYTGWLINNRHLFLTVLEAGKPKITGLEDLVSGESPDGCLLAVTSHGGRGLIYKGTNPTHRGGVLMMQSPPKGPTS